MLAGTRRRLFAPWTPGARADVRKTVPPPPAVEVGGLEGDAHNAYSDRLARTPHWRRMAMSDVELRMRENQTRYPFTKAPGAKPGQYDVRFLPAPRPDPIETPALVRLGWKYGIPKDLTVPVIFLRDAYGTVSAESTTADGAPSVSESKQLLGRRFETRYVKRELMQNYLHPSKIAVYATPEWYARLGLPVRDHGIHSEIPESNDDFVRLSQKRTWEDEPWKFTTYVRFRKYRDGPRELLDDATPWDGTEELAPSESTSSSVDGSTAKRGPKVMRKARKVKLF